MHQAPGGPNSPEGQVEYPKRGARTPHDTVRALVGEALSGLSHSCLIYVCIFGHLLGSMLLLIDVFVGRTRMDLHGAEHYR